MEVQALIPLESDDPCWHLVRSVDSRTSDDGSELLSCIAAAVVYSSPRCGWPASRGGGQSPGHGGLASASECSGQTSRLIFGFLFGWNKKINIRAPCLTRALLSAGPKASWWETPHGQGSEHWRALKRELRHPAKHRYTQPKTPFRCRVRSTERAGPHTEQRQHFAKARLEAARLLPAWRRGTGARLNGSGHSFGARE